MIGKSRLDRLIGRSLKVVSSAGQALRQFILFIPEGGYYIYAAIYKDGEESAFGDAEKLLKTFKRK